MNQHLVDEAATLHAGAALGRALARQTAFVTFQGELGAGKTTLVRAALRALGHDGPVRSPTYTLIESYPLSGGQVHHLDWYRLGGASDLDGLGFRDLLAPGHSVMVEWPERIQLIADHADLAVTLTYAQDARVLSAVAKTDVGVQLLAAWMTEIA